MSKNHWKPSPGSVRSLQIDFNIFELGSTRSQLGLTLFLNRAIRDEKRIGTHAIIVIIL